MDTIAARGTRTRTIVVLLALSAATTAHAQRPIATTARIEAAATALAQQPAAAPTDAQADEPSGRYAVLAVAGRETNGSSHHALATGRRDEVSPTSNDRAPTRTSTVGAASTPVDRFFDHADGPIVRSLATQEVAQVERGGGGRSLGFRVTLADGTRGYFKPAQTFNGMQWTSEVASYHLDRELGLARVAPVVTRRIAWSALRDAAIGDPRVDELIRDGDELDGALIWWVPTRLAALELPEGWEAWLRVDGDVPRSSPFHRRTLRRESAVEAPPIDETRAAELADLIVFDYLIHNADRWSENRANLRTVGAGGPLMHLDNAAGFILRRPRVALLDARLHACERFRRSTIDAVRALDVDAYAERVNADAELLDPRQVRNLATRRAHLLAYVDALVETHGEDAVYAW